MFLPKILGFLPLNLGILNQITQNRQVSLRYKPGVAKCDLNRQPIWSVSLKTFLVPQLNSFQFLKCAKEKPSRKCQIAQSSKVLVTWASRKIGWKIGNLKRMQVCEVSKNYYSWLRRFGLNPGKKKITRSGTITASIWSPPSPSTFKTLLSLQS